MFKSIKVKSAYRIDPNAKKTRQAEVLTLLHLHRHTFDAMILELESEKEESLAVKRNEAT